MLPAELTPHTLVLDPAEIRTSAPLICFQSAISPAPSAWDCCTGKLPRRTDRHSPHLCDMIVILSGKERLPERVRVQDGHVRLGDAPKGGWNGGPDCG
ncbi:xylanase/chitin deacetylase [Streptomyces laurentii]|uniref:Xylanase/chitin deacetylase n=1 Tax=Streptomyces laurentii TaxID=39478 RepID=A0A160P198_STRLU|nr:xylanase/chitin deacetylase [Streptomyces laurentii]